jgi:hypothetical protein
MILIGGNSPVQGFTSRARSTVYQMAPGVMLWNASAGPQDALYGPMGGWVHLVRCDNWGASETAHDYAARIAPTINRWLPVPNVAFVLGNEPDLEAGHNGGRIAEMADTIHLMNPGIKIGNPPLSVEKTSAMIADHCDLVCCHAYFERQHPEDRGNPQFGASYVYAMNIAGTRPVYVTEMNVVQTNCPIDWRDRNKQIADWTLMASNAGVAGVAYFILDASPDWASFDVGPEAMLDILAHLNVIPPLPVPVPPPEPPLPPPAPVPVPPPSPPVSVAYTRDFDPRAYAPLSAAWLPYITTHNPGEAAAICVAYDQACLQIGYDPNCAIAQGCVETEVFTSPRWKASHNAAGIGIYADGTPDVQFDTVDRGIKAQAELLSDYYCGGIEPWGVLKQFGFGGMNLHKTKLSDMDGVWAADVNYSKAIVGYLTGVIGTPSPLAPLVSGVDVVAQAMKDLGRDTFLDEGVIIPSYYRCEEAVEVWEERCGLPRFRYPDAQTDADSGPLFPGFAPIGARVFFKGTGWSVYGHVGISLGDGRTISALTVVSINDGWQHPDVGYIGWRYGLGVGSSATPVTPRYKQQRRPMVGDGFNDAEVQRLWYGTNTPSTAQKKKFPYNSDFGIEQSYAQLMNGTFNQGAQDYRGLSICLGQCISAEEEDAGTPGRSVRYFSAGKITAIKNVDSTYSFKVD